MSRLAISVARRHGVAILCVAVALTLNLFIKVEHLPAVLFLVAVTFSAWYGGVGAGVTATALSALALDYFFLPPIYAFDFGPATWVLLGTYLIAAIFISWLQEARLRLIVALRLRDEQRSEFISVLAHELRNFIAPVSSNVAIVKVIGAGDTTIRQACDAAERQIRSMTCLINDLLDAARITQGKLQLNLVTVDLRGVITEAVEAARPLIESRGHRLETSIPAGPMDLLADPVRLEQVFLNLLTNAAKYTDPGGRIWVIVERQDSGLMTRVRDDGKGLDPKVAPQLFGMFVQADNSSQSGLGIGLSLAKRLVEMHGGRVTAFSAGLGRGSEFQVYLPATHRNSVRSMPIQN